MTENNSIVWSESKTKQFGGKITTGYIQRVFDRMSESIKAAEVTRKIIE